MWGWLQVACVVAAWRGLAADELLDALAGRHGGNRVSLCLARAGGVCAGVLWRDRWLLARASCLEGHALYRVRVLRDCEGFTCEDFRAGRMVGEEGKVRTRAVAPQGQDLALVALESRFYNLMEHLANYSIAQELLSPYASWMEEVYKRHNRHNLSYAHKSSLFSSPLRMFMTTILVPTVTFVAIFVYVIFFTGSDGEIPYKNISYEESEASVKCT